MQILPHDFCTKRKTCQVPVNSWISSMIPEVLPRFLAGLGLELEHLALPERKFEQYLDSVKHSCLYQCHHHLNSTTILAYSLQYPLVLQQECCQHGVLVSRLMANFDKYFLFILVTESISIILLYSSSHQYDFYTRARPYRNLKAKIFLYTFAPVC